MFTLPALNCHISLKVRFSIFKVDAIEQSKTDRSNLWIDNKDENEGCHNYVLCQVEFFAISFVCIFDYSPKNCS